MSRYRQKLITTIATIYIALLSIPTFGQIPKLANIPSDLPAAQRETLTRQRAALLREREALKARIDAHNQKFAPENSAEEMQLRREAAQLETEKQRYVDAVKKFNQSIADVGRTLERSRPLTAAQPSPETDLKRIELSLAQFPPNASALVNMMNIASQNMKLPKGGSHENQSLNCSNFFRNMGEQLRKSGKPANGKEWTSTNFTANDIIDEIVNKKIEWQKVSEDEVQNLANRGMVVVGLQKGSSYGHISIAFPIPPRLDPNKFKGEGPFMRDGNEHLLTKTERRLYATTWGAAKASKAFKKDPNNPPTWYIWRPSQD